MNLDLDDLLYGCCNENKYRLLKKLIDVGVDYNCKNNYGYTFLQAAQLLPIDQKMIELYSDN